MRSRRVIGSILFAVVTLGATAPLLAQRAAAKPPKHRVVAMYFHRTQRCPTCQRISAYIEESIEAEFAEEVKHRAVQLYMIDYEDEKNAKYKKGYKITRPTLVLANVKDGRVSAWRPMPKVWSLVGKKDAFFKYVQDGIRAYLEEE
jgi:thiol-disulfide isomerase/thioredoxin